MRLASLDGTHPLGFLAALGTLAVLDDVGVRARLGFSERNATLTFPGPEPTEASILDALTL